MKTIIYNNTWPWFNSFFEFSAFEPIIKHDNPLVEEVSTTPNAYHFKYPVAGYNKRDINVTVQDNILSIEGLSKKRKSWWKSGGDSTYKNHFLRSTKLVHDMDVDKIVAKMKDGILSIEIPKKKEFISSWTIPVMGKSESDKRTSIIDDLKKRVGSLFKKSA